MGDAATAALLPTVAASDAAKAEAVTPAALAATAPSPTAVVLAVGPSCSEGEGDIRDLPRLLQVRPSQGAWDPLQSWLTQTEVLGTQYRGFPCLSPSCLTATRHSSRLRWKLKSLPPCLWINIPTPGPHSGTRLWKIAPSTAQGRNYVPHSLVFQSGTHFWCYVVVKAQTGGSAWVKFDSAAAGGRFTTPPGAPPGGPPPLPEEEQHHLVGIMYISTAPGVQVPGSSGSRGNSGSPGT